MSDTPRTDAAVCRYTGGELVTFPRGLTPVVPVDFAHTLERDLARVTAELAACKEDAARKAIQTLIALIDAAGGEVTIYASRYVCLPVTLTLTVEQTIDGNVVYRTRDAAIKEGS